MVDIITYDIYCLYWTFVDKNMQNLLSDILTTKQTNLKN